MLISFFIIYLIFICKYEKDEKLAKLAPLMAKFEKVTLNGSQKMKPVIKKLELLYQNTLKPFKDQMNS